MQSDLFAPDAPSAISASSEFLEGALLGDLAMALCVLAIAIIGLVALSGRLAIHSSAKTLFGCVLLLSSPSIAAELLGRQKSEPLASVSDRSVVFHSPSNSLHPAKSSLYSRASVSGRR